MNRNNIHKIANIISEDPDLIEDREDVVVTYTNHMGTENQYSIANAWPRFSGSTREFLGFNIEWPNKTIGFLKLDGLSEESYKLLKAQFGADHSSMYNFYARKRDLKRERRKGKQQTPKSRQIWNYMYKKYGRCCPNWHTQGHVPAGQGTWNDCWQSDEAGRSISHSVPNPKAVVLIAGSYLSGQLELKDSEGYWLVKLGGEQEEAFSDSEAAAEHLENRLSPPDMEEFRAELYDAKDTARNNTRVAMKRGETAQAAQPKPPSSKVIESDYGPITITRTPEGSIVISMEGEQPVEFEDPKAASGFLRNELGIETLIECRRRPSVLTEGIGPDDIKRILTELGYANIEFLTPNENEFQRLDVFGGVFMNDKLYQLGDPMTDISEDKIKRAIAKIEAGQLRELSPEEAEEVEDLQRDAHLFVIAAKKVGDKWVGLTLMSLDDPAHQFNAPDWKSDDGYQDGESAEEAMSVDDLDQMFNAPSFSPE